MNGIGFLVYSSDNSGEHPTAEWGYLINNNLIRGNGKAVRHIKGKRPFEGKFKVKYFDETNREVGDYVLEITSSNEIYQAKWYREKSLVLEGIGQLSNTALLMAWHDIS